MKFTETFLRGKRLHCSTWNILPSAGGRGRGRSATAPTPPPGTTHNTLRYRHFDGTMGAAGTCVLGPDVPTARHPSERPKDPTPTTQGRAEPGGGDVCTRPRRPPGPTTTPTTSKKGAERRGAGACPRAHAPHPTRHHTTATRRSPLPPLFFLRARQGWRATTATDGQIPLPNHPRQFAVSSPFPPRVFF